MCNSNQGTQFILNEIMYSGIFGLEKLNQIDFFTQTNLWHFVNNNSTKTIKNNIKSTVRNTRQSCSY
jgi:hypothetical protein